VCVCVSVWRCGCVCVDIHGVSGVYVGMQCMCGFLHGVYGVYVGMRVCVGG